MQELVGQTVTKIEVSEDNEYLRLTLKCGHDYKYVTYGDCCSSTWINEMTGVQSLLNSEIISVEHVDMDDIPRQDGFDVLQDYGVRIKTLAGYFDLIYRNESNGYYGGSLDSCQSVPETEMREVREDYSL